MRSLIKNIAIGCMLTLAMLLSVPKLGMAQNGMRFSQYMFNEMSFNPAYCGTSNFVKANLNYRNQWLNIEGAPETQMFSIDAPIHGKNIGLGGVFFRETIGIQRDFGAMITYAYRVNFDQSKLSFGLQGGFINKTIGWSDLRLVDKIDATFPSMDYNTWVPNFGFGVYYYSKQFYFGFSAPRILSNELPLDNSAQEYFSVSAGKIHYYATAAYVFNLNKELVIKPSILYKVVADGVNQIDLNLNLFMRNRVNVGLGFHSGDSYVLLLGYRVNDRLQLNYTYDVTYNHLMYNKPITNEFTLSYSFTSNYEKIRSPRYF